jgi:hypothetical protein
MASLIYILYLFLCSAILGLLGFWIGRCSRKVPIIDSNLPWTLNRAQSPAALRIPEEPEAPLLRWPR